MTDTSTVTVKPCPFCGLQEDEQYRPSLRETRDAIHDYTIGYSILCPCCGIEMHEEYQDDLLALWNGGTCNDDDEMNAIADERADGPFVAVALEPQTPAQAARVIESSKPARDAAFNAMWEVLATKHDAEVKTPEGSRYGITGDVVNEAMYAALRAIAGGE